MALGGDGRGGPRIKIKWPGTVKTEEGSMDGVTLDLGQHADLVVVVADRPDAAVVPRGVVGPGPHARARHAFTGQKNMAVPALAIRKPKSYRKKSPKPAALTRSR